MFQLKSRRMMQRMMMTAVLGLGLLLAGANNATAQTASIAGEWDAAMNTPGGVRNFKLVFTVEGEKLTGTVKRAAGDVPLVGTVKGNDIEFTYAVQYNGNNLTISMTGKLEGDAINGTVTFGESGQSDAWSAKRAVTPKPTSAGNLKSPQEVQ